MKGIQSALNQYNTNLTHAKGYLSSTENALASMGDLLKQVNTIAVSAANASTSQDARNQYATQITSIQDRLIGLANSVGPSGQYLFAGQKNSSAPFAVASGAATYAGDNNSIVAEVSPNQTMNLSTSLGSTIQTIYSQLESFKGNLTSGNTGTISNTDIANSKSMLETITDLRGSVGTQLQSVDSLTSQNQRRVDDLTTSISDNEDVDLAAAITKMQSAQLAYQAAMSVASQSFKTSLLDYMR
jgi:flagellar hook-associated protein 3 FlgL